MKPAIILARRALASNLPITEQDGLASITHEGLTYIAPIPLCVRCGQPATEWRYLATRAIACCADCYPLTQQTA